MSGLRHSIPLSVYPFVAVCLLPLLLFAQVPGSISIDPRLSWHTKGHDRNVQHFGSCPDLRFATVPGSVDLDPRLSWYTIESDHFDVHFSSRGRPDSSTTGLAREVADICEEVYATLTPVTSWAPRARTQIIIADFYDYFNGWAAPFPNNTITVIPTPPAGSKSNEGDWLRTLILHEYSHILQTDRVAGVPAALRKVFGRISMPNALAPAWLNEGYAVYNETRFTDFGRLRSAEYDMMARAAADSGRLLPVDRCGNYELQRFPGGGAPYFYGSWLHGHVASQGDSGIWDRYNRERSAGFPFFENLQARRTLGKSIYDLWSETQVGLITKAARLTDHISKKPVTPLRQITHEGFWTGSPLWSRNGARLYYVSETDREYPAIKMVDFSTPDSQLSTPIRTTALHRGIVTGNLSLSPDGRLLAFAELNLTGNYYEQTDIFAVDLVHGGVRQLTHGQRARDPDFASDTSLLVFVSNGRGQNDLKLLDLGTGEITALTETEDHTAFHGPRFSPSGKWIAVGVSRPGGYADIELVDRRTGWTIPVTHDRANDLSPTWSRTGKYVYFVSDRSGVFNLYAYQLATGKTFTVTNMQYGAFEPTISPDNRRIALTSFSASGYDIGITEVGAANWQLAGEFNDTLPGTTAERDMTELSDNSDRVPSRSQLYYYNPFPGILPAFWLPWAALSDNAQLQELGAFTLGWDALQFHQYQIKGAYDLLHRTPVVSATYTLRRYRPIVSLATNLFLQWQEGTLSIEVPFIQTRRSNWLELALTATHVLDVTARADLNWTYSDAHQFRFDVAPVEGRVIGLHADAPLLTPPSSLLPVRLLGYWYQYIGAPPQTWSLRTKLALGTAFGDSAASAFELGAQPGLLGVRGYPEASAAARSVLAAGLQFRAPLWWVERGIGTGPLFLQNINAAVFTDFGTTLNRTRSEDDSLTSRARLGVGAELRADLIVSHLLPVSLYGGCGFGLSPFWSYQLYFGFSSTMLEGILDSPLTTRHSSRPFTLRHLPETH